MGGVQLLCFETEDIEFFLQTTQYFALKESILLLLLQVAPRCL